MTDPVPYTGRNGNGHDPRRRVPTTDVGGDRGPSTGRRPPVLRAFEPDPRRGRLRCFRREAVRSVLRADGATESGSGPLLSAALGRLLRGPGLGAGDPVAGCGFAGPTILSASGAAGVATRPLDDLANACRLLSLEAHRAVFTWVLQQLADAGLLRGKTVGRCRAVQGRHALQTSDALGAAGVQLGPGAAALVVELHTEMGYRWRRSPTCLVGPPPGVQRPIAASGPRSPASVARPGVASHRSGASGGRSPAATCWRHARAASTPREAAPPRRAGVLSGRRRTARNH